MIYKPIKLKDGTVYLCRFILESATELPLTKQELVILELSERLSEGEILT